MKIGLFFGSFNPVHIGHMILANYIATHSDMDEVWMVVSPQNPLKSKKSLAKDHDRLHLVRLAIGDNPLLRPSDIEFNLPIPSYTVDTLAYLKEKHPNKTFTLIMGGDSLASLHKWKNYEVLLRDHRIIVYTRPGYEVGSLKNHPSITILKDTPLMQISASYIRQCIKENKSIEYLVPEAVYQELLKSNIYKDL